MHREFHQAKCSFVWGKLLIQSLYKHRYLIQNKKSTWIYWIVDFTLTTSKIINWICKSFFSCATFIILSTPALHLIEFTIGDVRMIGFCTDLNRSNRKIIFADENKTVGLPLNVHLLDLHSQQYKHIQRHHLCLIHMFHHHDI